MAGKRGGGVKRTSWKPGQSGNPAGRPPRRSFRVHFDTAFDDATRNKIAESYARKAAGGSIPHLEVALRILGDIGQPAAGNINILALITAQPGGRELAQRLFAALPLGSGDAGGMGGIREPWGGSESAGMDALGASDDDQRRPATDRDG